MVLYKEIMILWDKIDFRLKRKKSYQSVNELKILSLSNSFVNVPNYGSKTTVKYVRLKFTIKMTLL